MAKLWANQISNRNFLSPVGFKFSISKIPKADFFANQANIPGIDLGFAVQPTYLKDLPVPGDKLTYDQFSMTFLVDEKMKNFIELHDWLINMAAPQKNSQFMARTSDYVLDAGQRTKFYRDIEGVSTEVTGNTSDRELYCDIQIFILSSKNNPVAKFTLQNAFPVSLSALDYSSQDTDTNYVSCNVSFAFPFYTIESL